MPGITPPPALVHTEFSPRLVAQAQNVVHSEAFLHGRETGMHGRADQPAGLVIDFGEELVGTLELAGQAGATCVWRFFTERT